MAAAAAVLPVQPSGLLVHAVRPPPVAERDKHSDRICKELNILSNGGCSCSFARAAIGATGPHGPCPACCLERHTLGPVLQGTQHTEQWRLQLQFCPCTHRRFCSTRSVRRLLSRDTHSDRICKELNILSNGGCSCSLSV